MSGAPTTPCPVALWAEKTPEGIALRGDGGELTWGEWHARITDVEDRLRTSNVVSGMRVGLCLPTGDGLLSLLIAIFRRGAVACPVNPQYPEAYRNGLLARLDCALVVDGDCAGGAGDSAGLHVREAVASATVFTPPTPPQGPVGLASSRGKAIDCGLSVIPANAGIQQRAEINFAKSLDPRIRGDDSTAEFPYCEDTLASAQSARPAWHLDPPATILFTSGSTGEPKAAVLSLRNHLESARRSNANIPLGQGDTWLLSLPMHHVAGFGVLFRCLAAGATMAIPESGDVMCASAASLGVTHVSLVARQLARLLDAGPLPGTLRAILLGGSAMPAPLLDRACAAGLPVHTSYGMTETASQIAATPPRATRLELATSGRPLAPGAIRIGEDGRIQVNGPARFLGYWKDGALEYPFDEEGWFTTSDCGHFDGDGFLHVTGRKDNVFIAGGENIQPEEIERALCALPGITQAIVVPVPHADFGATPCAFIEHAGIPDLEVIREALSAVLPRFKVPRHVFPWPIELAEAGIKISRAALAKKAAKDLEAP